MKKICGLMIVMGLSGCATMFGDNNRQINVNSQPTGAQVFYNGNPYGVTPTTIRMPNYIYGANTITIRKDGYYDQSTNISGEFQAVGWWNLLNFPIGFAVDAADGNMLKIDPSQQNINLIMQAKK